MKKIHSILFLLVLMFCVPLHAKKTSLKYVDAQNFRIVNRGWKDQVPAYTRVPDARLHLLRPELKYGSQSSTGIGIRFRTNSKTIGARYNLKYDFGITWMAYTGIKGSDLYMLDGEDWRYIATARPIKDSIQDKVYIKTLDGEMREYLIYLPLYDGINWFEIGVDSTAVIEYPQVDNPKSSAKVLFYGTSVMQGGCACRVGMTQTTILQRRLGVECVNLGFSGEAKLWPENAKMLADADDNIECIVLDPLMNNTKEMVDTLSEQFVRIIREAHPNTPIIMVEGEIQPHQEYDTHLREYNPLRNKYWEDCYKRLKKSGMKNLYFMYGGDYTCPDGDGTVDGDHLTDLGFVEYANRIEPLLRKVLRKQKVTLKK
jgi:hypothetical protein